MHHVYARTVKDWDAQYETTEAILNCKDSITCHLYQTLWWPRQGQLTLLHATCTRLFDDLSKASWSVFTYSQVACDNPLCFPELLGTHGLLHLIWPQQTNGWVVHFVHICVDKLRHFVSGILGHPSLLSLLVTKWQLLGPERRTMWLIPKGTTDLIRYECVWLQEVQRPRGSEQLSFPITNMDNLSQMSLFSPLVAMINMSPHLTEL